MLIRFEVANFRSILEPVELSMVAVDRDRDAARPFDNIGESLLTVAAIYGPNASGKSNIIAALTWLRDAVLNSLRGWDDDIPIEPFAFSEGHSRPTEFTIESIVKGVRFEYVVELTREKVHYEGLFHYPEKKRRRIYERSGQELKLQRGLGNLSGTRELLTDRTLALSAARRFDEPLVSEFAQDLLSGQTYGPRGPFHSGRTKSPRHPYPSSCHWFKSDNRIRALAMLRLADLGIDDVVFRQIGAPSLTPDGDLTFTQELVQFVHQSGDEQVELGLIDESEGTQTWFRLIGPVLSALTAGSLLLFDELDASLHPTLSMQLIRLFQDPVTNPAGAQLVFTSHDTSLLNHLNRDEVWLTEKPKDGATRLGALAEFAGERVRKSQNLEKAYLHGRFGALPEVDRTEFLRALGLIG
ncbi:AAA family ATPase [Actinokineospora sp. 24-640]